MSSPSQKRSRRRRQKLVLELFASGRPIAIALRDSNVSGSVFRRWWIYDAVFRRQWDLACEALRDSIVQKAVERVNKGDDASLRTLLAVLEGPLSPKKAWRAENALASQRWKDIMRDVRAQRDLHRQVEDIASGRAPRKPVQAPTDEGYSW